MTKPPMFIELCAGTAALSLRLQGGPKAKPPVSRMGAKTGYADAILAVLGLYPGQGAESYLWCEPDDGVRGLLMAYPQPEVLRAAAAILRSWKDEEPRALWERLRAELKAGMAVEGAEGVARVCMVLGCSMSGTEDRYSGWFNPQGEAACAWHGEAKIAQLVAAHGRDNKGRPLAKSSAHPDNLAPRLEGMAERTYPPTFIARDGRAVTPEEVAGWCVLGANAYRQGEPDSGYRDFAKAYAKGTRGPPPSNEALAGALGEVPPFPPVTIVADGRVVSPHRVAAEVLTRAYSNGDTPGLRQSWSGGYRGPGGEHGHTTALPDEVGERLIEMATEWPPVTLTADARDLTPPKLPPGVVAYMDPPYLDTTGYKHDLPRSEVVRMARLWADAGATVCISEAEAIPELIADGWHAVEISATRRGAKRTFSKQQAEWLTLSRPPSFVPRQSLDLFAWSK